MEWLRRKLFAPPHGLFSFRTALIGSALLVFLAAISVTVGSQARTGEVASVRKGKLFHKAGDQWRELSRGDAVRYGSTIRTDRKAIAVINFPEQGRLVVGPSTTMVIGENSNDLEASMSNGRIWIDAQRLGKDRTIQVTTPQMVSGVRGTKFAVMADDEGAATCTCEGLVSVTVPGDTGVDTAVIPTPGEHFLEIGADGSRPDSAQPDIHLLRRMRRDRYDWCFSCHVVGGRGELKKDWTDL